jgi:two-component sensor histidine kinase
VLFIMGWTALSLMFVPEVYLYFLYRSEGIPFAHTVALALANAGIACLFLPPIIWLTRHVPIEHGRWRRAMAFHIPACLVFALSHSGLYAALCYASPSLFHALFVRFHPNLLTYWAIVGFTQAVDYFDRYRDRERRLAEAELLLMKAQLQPHFLFNTLHTISAMVREDAAGAERMIARLSDLLRLLLANIGAHEVPFRSELDFVRSYVEIQKVRYGGQLDLNVSPSPQILDALVPSMILQPFVENAIRHGFDARSGDRLTIEISGFRDTSSAVIAIADDGRGVCSGADLREGIGLSNVRARMRELYGSRATLEIGSRHPAGCSVRITLPYHTSRSSDEDDVFTVSDNTNDHRRRRGVGAQTVARSA